MSQPAKPARKSSRARCKPEPVSRTATPKTNARDPAKRWRAPFLSRLAETSNVRAACEHAGISAATVYDLRRRDRAFAARWMEALCEGYDNLEMELLDRLRSGDDKGGNRFDHAVAFRMLQAHRDNVAREKARRANVDAGAIRASIDRKVAEMRALVLGDTLLADTPENEPAAGQTDGDETDEGADAAN